MTGRVPRTAAVLLAVAALAAALSRLGSHPLLDPVESRLARITVEMQRGPDWVLPRFEGRPAASLPLLHWLQAPFFRALGAGAWAARLPAALAVIGLVLLTAWAARRRFGDEGALWAAAILATTPLAAAFAGIGSPDALVALHVLAVVVLETAAAEDAGPGHAGAVGALLGLVFLAGGAAGVALALIVVMAGRTASGQELIPGFRSASVGIAAWGAVALPWTLAFAGRLGAGAGSAVLRDALLGPLIAGESAPPWTYAPLLAAGLGPWTGPLVAGVARALGRARDPEARTGLYASAGLLAGLLFLSFLRAKPAGMLLPLTPLAALVITWELGQEIENPARRRSGGSLLALGLVIATVVLGGYASIPSRGGTLAAALAAGAMGAGALVSLGGVYLRRPRWIFGAAAVASSVAIAALAWGLPGALAETRSTAPLVRDVPALATRPVVVAGEGAGLEGLAFYLDRAPERMPLSSLAARLDRGGDPLVVVRGLDARDLPAEVRGRLRLLATHGDLRVFEPSSRK